MKTGTDGRESKTAKAVAAGPKGWKSASLSSEAKMEAPLASWVVRTRRGFGRPTTLDEGGWVAIMIY